jgi:hypothetical protein
MSPRLSSKLRDLTHAEVLQWNLAEVPYQVSERQGPVEVFNRGILIAAYPFYAHWVMDGRTGALYVIDPIARKRLGIHEAGTWNEVGHGLHRPFWIGGQRLP